MLKELIYNSWKNKKAIPHFNISELVTLKAIAEISKEMNQPILVGTSEGERDFIGINQFIALIKSYRKEGIMLFANADHTKSIEKAKIAIDSQYDTITIDGSSLPIEENIKLVKEIKEYAQKINHLMLIEGELGYIGSGSEMRDSIPEGVNLSEDNLTSVKDALYFIENTGIDLFSPSVGNIHGIIKSGEPDLNIKRINELSNYLKIPMVLHGASGNSDKDIRNAVINGMTIVHISTEIRLTWRNNIEKFLLENKNEVSPTKILTPAYNEIKKLIKHKIEILNGIIK